tara:strand:- start:811 stop:2016 length:1206 start_codon:yes stop_codon:yes gene_type:complete
MAKPIFTDDDDALLGELGVEVEQKKAPTRTPREERIIAGFEDIQRFYEESGRAPLHGEDGDIFERLYAVRLDRLRALKECRELLEPLDHQGILGVAPASTEKDADLDDEELLKQLGVEDATAPLTELKHVRPAAEKRAAEEIARREQCSDFEKFKPLFEQIQSDLKSGLRITRQIRKGAGFLKAGVSAGQFYIIGGQIAYIAKVGEPIRATNGEFDARLRVIFDNGTESNLLLRSFQRALYNDEASRMVSDNEDGPLFSGDAGDGDQESGTIYVLRSKSDLPQIRDNRSVIHKIGVTGGDPKRRIANAEKEATYLLAGVEIVREYKLFNINRTKLEKLIHRIFAPARLDFEITDRFGNPFKPTEWFLAPIDAIDQAVELIKSGEISGVRYDPETASMRPRN